MVTIYIVRIKKQQCAVAMQLARHIFSAKRRETYVLAASVVRFHPLLLLPFLARATLAGLERLLSAAAVPPW